MASLTFVQGDLAPSITGNLTHSDGTVYDLTDTTVRFQMRLSIDRRWAVNAPAVIVDAATGRVRYDWQAGDLDEAGDYSGRWLITFLDGSGEHTNPINGITVAAQ